MAPGPQPPPQESFYVNFHEGANVDLSDNPYLMFQNGPGNANPPVRFRFDGYDAFRPPIGSFIGVRHPHFENEALEINCVLPQATHTSPVLVCGNGQDNAAALQLIHQDSSIVNNRRTFFRTFGTPTALTDFNFPEFDRLRPASPVRLVLRLERRGTNLEFSATLRRQNPPFFTQRTSTVLGTNLAAWHADMPAMNFATGIFFPMANANIVSIKWEAL